MHQYYVYIMANRSRSTLYLGMTNDLARRVYEHRHKLTSGFSARYNTTLLLHYEVFDYVNDAIAREKEIKRWRREKKDRLITANNPTWDDLSALIFDDHC